MNGRDDLLRAHVYRAHGLRGSEDFGQACSDAVDGWTLWPAVEYAHALEVARRDEDELLAWYEAIEAPHHCPEISVEWAIEWIRSSYPADAEEVAA